MSTTSWPLTGDLLATAHDEAAARRDITGLGRDAGASYRDRAAREIDEDRDGGAIDRFMSGRDRDLAAGDRADAVEDHRRARAGRDRAASDRERAASDRERAATQRREASDHTTALEQELLGLREALASRLVIGQAEGVLIARYGINEDGAFKLLIKLSQHTHVKLRDVAARIVRDATSG